MRMLRSSDKTGTGMNEVINESDRQGRNFTWPAGPHLYRQ